MTAKKKQDAKDKVAKETKEETKTYIVLENFYDLEDDKRLYKKGAVYPRKGYKPTKERIEALLTNKNRVGRPFIK